MTQKALLQSAGDGTAVPSGYVGEVISYDSGDGTNKTVNTNYDYTVATNIPAGNYLILISVRPALFLNQGNTLNAGLFNVIYSLGTSAAGATEIGEYTITLPSWGNAGSSYAQNFTYQTAISKNSTWSIFSRVNASTLGTTGPMGWFRVGAINIKLVRVS